MLKQSSKSSQLASKQIHEDIQFLLSNIRARQNGLIFFLERFSSQCKTHQQFIVYREQFLQKEKIYANQVSRVIDKFVTDKRFEEEIKQFVRTFWIKVKSIIKVSLDRLRMLKLLNERIFSRYEEIINLVNKNYDEEKNIQEFSNVENLLKRRNVDALICSRNYFDSPGSQNKILKNRSESAFKHSSKYTPKPQKYGQDSFRNEEINQFVKLNFEESKDERDPEIRMKSLNRYRKKKIILDSKNPDSKNVQKLYKKIAKCVDRFQKSLEGAMDCVIQLNIDKKKSIKENSQAMYDQLFKKNIPNHKMISKFVFGACGIAQLLVKRKNLKNKKILTSKTEKINRQSKDTDKKIKTRTIKQIKEKEKPKEKQKQKERPREKSKERPFSAFTAQIKGIFEQEKRKMIQTTLIFQDKKNSKYRKKIGARLEKYTRILKPIL